MPNPRGSYGQGEAFTRANVKDFGYGDWRDDLAASTRRSGRVRSIRTDLGLMGWSYGGYMAMWAETQTARFKAIVAGAGVVNWQSYYGQNKIDQWMIPFFGASVYQDPAVYAKQLADHVHPALEDAGLDPPGRARRRSSRARKRSSSGTRWTTLGVPTKPRRLCRRGPRVPKDPRPDRHSDANRCLVRSLPKIVARL